MRAQAYGLGFTMFLFMTNEYGYTDLEASVLLGKVSSWIRSCADVDLRLERGCGPD